MMASAIDMRCPNPKRMDAACPPGQRTGTALVDMTGFDDKATLRLGGWDPRYAVVLATDARDGVTAALVDTNARVDVDLDQYEQAADGRWVEVSSGNCGESGAFAAGFMALAWGRTDPRAAVRVEHQAATHTVGAHGPGWWMFVIPSRSSDVPTVATRPRAEYGERPDDQ